ncbi:MAG: RND family transporter [Thermotogaceae bacterium]|nr:RND family transporter [Thermotogaceae bacterium]
MKRYVEFVSKNSRKVMMIIILINVIAFFGLLRIRINTSYGTFVPTKSVQEELLKKYSEEFNSQDMLMFVVEYDGDIYTLEGLNFIKNTEKILKNINGVSAVISAVPDSIPAGFLRLEKIDKITEENFKNIVDYVKEKKVVDLIAKKDGKYYALFNIILAPDSDARKVIKSIEKEFEGKNYRLSGNLYIQEKLVDYILVILFTIPPSAFLIIFLVFKWQLGNKQATLLSIVPAGLGALWSLGLMGWATGEITTLTVLVPIFTLILGSADGLHFMSHYIEERRKKGYKEAVLSTLQIVGKAMIMTTLTTMAGFASLVVINSKAIAQMGLYAAAGIFLAGAATWLFLPAFLLSRDHVFKIKESSGREKVVKFITWLKGHSYIFTIVLVIAFIPGMFMIKTNFNMFDMYKKHTKIRKNAEFIFETFNQTLPVFGVLSFDNDPLDPDNATRILNFERSLSKEFVVKSYSIYDIMGFLYRKLYGDNREYPDSLPKAKFLFSLMRRFESKNIENLINTKDKDVNIIIFPRDHKSETLTYIEKSVKDAGGISYGIPFTIKEMNDGIIIQQIKSIALSLSLVFLMLILSQRSIIVAFFSLMPIVATLITLFGFFGYANIDLSIVTVTMASIVIGVGIDYSIHLVALFRYYKNAEKTVTSASRPILANAMGLAIGYSVLLLSPLTVHTYLSEMMWVSMTASSLLSLTLLPTLLEKFYRK